MKLNFHSFVDVITNSSTVIYTYQSSAINAAKELLAEMLKFSGETKTVEELFSIEVFSDDAYSDYDYEYGDEKNEEKDPFKDMDYKEKDKAIENIKSDILDGKIKKPQWMINAESNESYNGYSPSCYLHIKAKDEKYDSIAKQMLKFLNSTDNEGGFDG